MRHGRGVNTAHVAWAGDREPKYGPAALLVPDPYKCCVPAALLLPNPFVCGCPLLQGVLWRALWRVHARRLLLTAAVKVVHDLLMFLQPYILELLLHHLSSGARDRCGGVLTQ